MTLTIFGYQILVLKSRKQIPTISNAVKLSADGHFLYLCNQNGDPLPGQIACTLYERINKPPYAVVEIMVNIDELLEKGKTVKLCAE